VDNRQYIDMTQSPCQSRITTSKLNNPRLCRTPTNIARYRTPKWYSRRTNDVRNTDINCWQCHRGYGWIASMSCCQRSALDSHLLVCSEMFYQHNYLASRSSTHRSRPRCQQNNDKNPSRLYKRCILLSIQMSTNRCKARTRFV